jgi:Fe-S-cluster containining protein
MNNDLIQVWRNRSEKDTRQVFDFLDELTFNRSEQIDAEASVLHKEIFTEINCLDCANCCKTTPAVLLSSDIKRIAKFLKISPKLFVRKYVLEDINGELSFRKVPCVFLEADNKCAVYAVRPVACKDYPHTESSGFLRRRKLHKANVKICPASYFILKRMDK